MTMNLATDDHTRRTVLSTAAVGVGAVILAPWRHKHHRCKAGHMTINTGDQPDFSTLTSPNFQAVSVSGQGSLATGHLVTGALPFRIWGVWIDFYYVADSTGPGALSAAAIILRDLAGNNFAIRQPLISNPNEKAQDSISFPTYGVKAQASGGTYELDLVTLGGQAHTFLNVNAGAFISFP